MTALRFQLDNQIGLSQIGRLCENRNKFQKRLNLNLIRGKIFLRIEDLDNK